MISTFARRSLATVTALASLLLLMMNGAGAGDSSPSAAPVCPVPVLRRITFSGMPSGVATDAIRIGVLHSLTGAQAASERPLVDAALLAVEEINAKGGIHGKSVTAFTADGASDPATFAELAEKLITTDKVSSIFGCWTSASRKAVLPVVEKHQHLLWNAVAYEGGEASKRVIHGGSTPDQLIPPLIDWCVTHLGKRLMLVGTADDFSHAAGALVKAQLEKSGGTLLDAVYLKPEDHDLRELVQQIRTAVPDAVINTIAGDANDALFRGLGLAGIGSHQVPVISLGLYEEEVLSIGPELVAGHYAVHAYFQSLASPANKKFVRAFKRRYGLDRVVDDPMESIYGLVHLFARAADKAGSTDVEAIRKAALGEELEVPSGTVKLDPETQQLKKSVRIGQIGKDGQFQIIWSSPGADKSGRADK